MTPEIPCVSAIIVSWNRRRDLLTCLESLTQLQYPVFDITVFDNGSMDGSVKAVRERYPKVRVLASDTNIGTSESRNAAVAATRGDYLWFLDSDTFATRKDAIERLLSALNRQPQIGAVGGEAVIDRDERIVGVKTMRLCPNGLTQGTQVADPEGTFEVDLLPTCNLFMPRKTFREIGGFDPLFFFFLEDLDLCWRIKRAGYALLATAAAGVVHRFSESSRNRAALVPRRNRVFFAVKHFPWSRIALLPILDLAYLFGPGRLSAFLRRSRTEDVGAKAMVTAQHGPSKPTLSGLWAATRHAFWLIVSLPVSYLMALPHWRKMLKARYRQSGTFRERPTLSG